MFLWIRKRFYPWVVVCDGQIVDGGRNMKDAEDRGAEWAISAPFGESVMHRWNMTTVRKR